MDPKIVADIEMGSEIQVLYEVVRNGGVQKVWWPAVVKKVVARHDTHGFKLSGSVRFKAMLGYGCTTKYFTFQGQDVIDADANRHSWRHSVEAEDPGEPSSDDEEEEGLGIEQEYHPPHEKNKKRKSVTQEREELKVCDEEGEANYVQLQQRLDTAEHRLLTWEQKISLQSLQIGQVQKECDDLRHSRNLSIFDRVKTSPLQYLGYRLMHAFRKKLSNTAKPRSAELRTGFTVYNQDNIRSSADCTLLQFDEIVAKLRAAGHQGLSFSPSLLSLSRRNTSNATVHFNGMETLLLVFSSDAKDSLRNCLVKRRVDKATGNVTVIRTVGCALQSDTNDTMAMYVTVGHGLPVSNDCTDLVNVIRRKNTTWNVVECMFNEPVEATSMNSRDLFSEFSLLHVTEEERQKVISKAGFAMTWRRESHLDDDNVFANPVPRGNILGNLEVSVPVVTVRGEPHIKEFSEALESMGL